MFGWRKYSSVFVTKAMQYRWLDVVFLLESRFIPVVVARFRSKHPGFPKGPGRYV